MQRQEKKQEVQFEVVVVGGGLAGLCAALASAREGAKTALIQDRSVLGGNASSEIRMHVCGASSNATKRNLEETGILYEIMLDNKRFNNSYNYSVWDAMLFRAVKREQNLTLYLNTTMHGVQCEHNVIQEIHCYQLTTEIHWTFRADLFIDCTGNGTLGYLAGAKYCTGSEAKGTFDEPDAPTKPNQDRMGNTLLFKAIDCGHPVTFVAPDFAWKFSEEQLRYRRHGNEDALFNVSDEHGTTLWNEASHSSKQFDAYCLDYGYWWIELSGKSPDIIAEYESIRDDLVGCIYGVWDHIKNGGDHRADNFDLLWVGMLPGVRESRRLLGDYILNENDILQNKMFEDMVAYGGWPMDVHTPNGLLDYDKLPTVPRFFSGIYSIPYRCYYSKNIENLFMGGRLISASRLAMSSSRVMGTCAVGGQAIGTAAAMCIKKKLYPRALGKHIQELQQRLLRNDCYLPSVHNTDALDIAKNALVTAQSEAAGCEAAHVIDGITRNVNDEIHYWSSVGLEQAVLRLSWDKPQKVSTVQLVFDSDLSIPIKQTMSSKRIKQQQAGIPKELVADYVVIAYREGRQVACKEIRDNWQRVNIVLIESIACDALEMTITRTNGCQDARVFEIRVYS